MSNPKSTYTYQAQTAEGLPMSGTIEATDGDHAREQLTLLGVRVLMMDQAKPDQSKPKPIRGDDLIVFNQHLAQLTKAGMPVEHGLRIIAQDMRSGRLKSSINAVLQELENGAPLDKAFEVHRDQFPPLYGKLVKAGISANNLPGMLMNLGRHYELISRLRASLWQALTYPMLLIFMIMVITSFLSVVVVPQFMAIFSDWDMSLPASTRFVIQAGGAAPFVITVLAILLGAILTLWFLAQLFHFDQWIVQNLIAPIPLLGSLLKRSAVARWCDAASMGIEAGMPLPDAIEMAGDAVGWEKLKVDGWVMVRNIIEGQPIVLRPGGDSAMLPFSVRTAIAMSHERMALAQTLRSIAQMYQQLTEHRLTSLMATITPIMIILGGLVVFSTVLMLFLPFLNIMTSLTG